MSSRLTPSLRLALIYLIFSVLWILLSDGWVRNLAGDNMELLEKFQRVKGILFVLLSGILLYAASRRLYRNIETSGKEKEAILTKFRAINETAKEGIVDYDLVKDEAVINEQMRVLMGKNSNVVPEFSAAHILRIHPDDLDRVYKNFLDTIHSNAKFWQAEYRYLYNDKTYRDIITKGFIVRDAVTNKAIHFIGTIQDVTEIRDMKAIYHEQQIHHKQMLAKSIIAAQEKERNRWAEELHDSVCQMLTVAKLLLEQVPDAVRQDAGIDKSRQMVSKALNEIRQLSMSIKPPEFSHTTLYEAIDELTTNLNRIKPYKFDVDINQLDEDQLTSEQKLMVYRVIQEQFNNIIKYADAGTISVHLRSEEEKVFIEISDDGVGFNTEKIEAGLGLRNIRGRLQVYAGNMNIESAPGKGCTLMANFSLL